MIKRVASKLSNQTNWVTFEREQTESLVSWALLLLADLRTFRAPEPSPYRVSLDWGDTFLVLFHVTKLLIVSVTVMWRECRILTAQSSLSQDFNSI